MTRTGRTTVGHAATKLGREGGPTYVVRTCPRGAPETHPRRARGGRVVLTDPHRIEPVAARGAHLIEEALEPRGRAFAGRKLRVQQGPKFMPVSLRALRYRVSGRRPAASRTASRIRLYPAQRQKLPERNSRIS